MKNRILIKLLLSSWICLSFLFPVNLKAQQTLTTIGGWNAYVHLPDDYTTTTSRYPVIVFIPGVGEVGTDPSKLLVYGPSYYISQGASMNFTINGVTHKPIVISMQPPAAWPNAILMKRQMDSVLRRWRVDSSRIYMTGLSMGGWACDNFITGNTAYAAMPAAIVAMSAPEADNPLANYAWYANSGGKWWGFEGTLDYRKMDLVRDQLNNTVAGTARYTQYVGGHCCWNTWYNPAWTSTDGESIYTWMLKQSKTGSININMPPVANAGSPSSVSLPVNFATLNGSGTDADGTITSYLWTKVSGPSQFTITSPTTPVTTVTNLVAGVYTFRLKVTDNSGASDSASVNVTVTDPSTATCNTNAPAIFTLQRTASTEVYMPNTAGNLGWKGGDTVRIPAGNYSLIDLGNFRGDSCRPIVFINYGGRVVVSQMRFGNNAAYFKLCGQGDPAYEYGFLVNGVVNAGVAITTAHHVEVCNVEVTGPEVGFYFKKNPTTTDPLSMYPNFVLSNYYIHHNYLHDLHGEGMYIGHTYPNADPYSGNLIPIRMDKVEIAYNTVDGTDWDGIQLSNARTQAKIHHNTVRNFGRINMGSQQAGIIIGGNTNGDVYDNYVSNGTGNGIEAFGFGTIRIYNNTIDSSGADGTATGQESVYTNDPINLVETNPLQQIQFYNNIVKNPKTRGAIRIAAYNSNSLTATVRDNQYCIPAAGSNWQTAYIIVNIAGSTITNNVLMSNCAAPNQAPTANAGTDISITLPVNNTTLNGSGTDPDGSIASYQWTKIAGPATYTITSATSAVTTLTGLVQGVYQFRLQVTDNGGLSAADTVQVTVNAAANQAPTANAGTNISITLPVNNTTLNGSGTDPDGSIASYQWTKIAGPTTYTITSATSAVTTLTGLVQGVYQFRLQVTDNGGLTAADTVQVTVNAAPNQAPTANAGTNISITLPVNNTTLNGSGTDPDGSIASYQWTKIAGPATYTITSATSAVTTLTGLVQGVYQFRLQVTDNGGLTAADTVQVTVNAAPNQAPTANAGTNISITLPVNNTTLNGSGTDPDGSIASYQWTKIAGPTTYTITSATSAVTTLTGLVQGVYQFRLQVTDNGGLSAADTVQVTVNAAANQAPTANAGTNISITLPVNNTTLNGSGTDPDGSITSYQWTKIAGPATYTITNAAAAVTNLTGLVQGVYQFRLQVTDNGGLTAADTVQVTVNAAANQAPTANAGTNISITLPVNNTTLNGSGTDPDGSIASYQWTKIAGPATYTITNAAAAVTNLTGLVQGVYQFRLQVTDNGGLSAADTVQVTVNAAANQAPTANAGTDITITLPVNNTTLNGSGTDPDGSIASYQWTKIAGPATYTITSATSAVTTLTGLVQGVYQFRLQVTDNGGLSAADTVQVTVNSAPNQAPVVSAGPDRVLTLPENFTVLNGSASDPDGSIASYQWSKIAGPASFVVLSPASAVTNINTLVQGTYTFVLTATDNLGLSASDTVQVFVNAAPNQAPTANAGTDITITLPVNNTTLNGSGTDPDGSITSYQWTKIAGPATFAISNPASAVTNITSLVQGVYQFRLQVTDNGGLTAADTVQVTVNAAPNQAPTANAGTDITITLPVNNTTLNGSGTDPDGSIASYQWTKIAGPATFAISNPASAVTNITSLVQGVYQFRLQVTDNGGLTAADTVQVTVNAAPNLAPTVNAGADILITLPVDSVRLTGTAADADGSVVSYTWRKIMGPAQYQLADASSIETMLRNLVEGDYVFELKVTDNDGATATDTMNVTVKKNTNLRSGAVNIKLFPNPATTEINLSTRFDEDGKPYSVQIFNASGSIVYQNMSLETTSSTRIQTINIANLQDGMYFMQVVLSPTRRSMIQFVKQ